MALDLGSLAWNAALVIFGAGGAWFKIRLHDRQLNGLGRKTTRAIVLQIVMENNREERWRIARMHFGD